MKYFTETEQLLSEPSFLEFAQSEYQSFIAMDQDDHIRRHSQGERFTFNIKGWYLTIDRKDPLRPIAGGMGSFLLYARIEAQKLIYNDWKEFKKELIKISATNTKAHNNAIDGFVEEAELLRNTIAARPYLKRLEDWLYEVITSISNEYKTSFKSSPQNKRMEQQLDKMNWNGNINVLSTIFYELANMKLSNGKGVYLDATPEQLTQLIVSNFTHKGEEIPESTISTHLQVGKPEKRATTRKIHLEPIMNKEA